jgi:hypothetical protein
MSASMSADLDLAVLVALKRDVTSLIEHIKDGATNPVQNAADQIDRGLRSLRQQGGAEGARSAKAISFVEKQPFVALMIAIGIGYIGARVLRR